MMKFNCTDDPIFNLSDRCIEYLENQHNLTKLGRKTVTYKNHIGNENKADNGMIGIKTFEL